MKLDLMNFLLKLLRYPYIFNRLFVGLSGKE